MTIVVGSMPFNPTKDRKTTMSETPQFLGIVSGERRRTHTEVANRADRIASGLAKIGVRQGDCVCW